MVADVAPIAVDSAPLAGSFGGPLIAPDSPDYDAARRSFNAFVDRRPALIAQPLDRDDVAAALAYGRSVGLPIAIRGGGHSVAGHGLVDDGLVIDLRRMRSVSVDPVARLARAAGGCQWTDLDAATQAHGLAVPGGTFGDTGIAGLTLGGGIGFLMGIGGYTCDNLIGAELVTADGAIVEVSATATPDLLWALRGGGGNFGIVTRLDYRLLEVGPMYGGEFGVRGDDVPAFVARWLAALPDLPDELSPMFFLSANPEVGQIGHVQVSYVGDPAAGDAIVRPIVAPFEPVYDDLGPRTYLEIQAMNGELPFGMRHYWKATFLRELEAPGLDAVVTAHARRIGGASGVLIEPIRAPPDASRPITRHSGPATQPSTSARSRSTRTRPRTPARSPGRARPRHHSDRGPSIGATSTT